MRDEKEQLTPDQEEAQKLHYLACDFFLKKKNPHMAFDLWLQAIELDPYVVDYRLNLGAMCIHLGKPFQFYTDLAIINAVTATRMAPERQDVWQAVIEYSLNASKFPEAITAAERAIAADPNNARLWTLKSFCHHRNAQREEAYDCALRAVELDPEMGEAHFLISYNATTDRFDPQKQAFHGERGFTAKKPCTTPLISCWQSAHGYLALGDYAKGFDYFEARLRLDAMLLGGSSPLARYRQPRWRGEKNCTVLIHPEMGLGDSFLMLRFLRVAQKKFNVKVIFECFPQMIDLVRFNFPDIAIAEFGKVTADFDYQLPMMSLPHYCKVRSDSVPNTPYIGAEPNKVAEWLKYFNGQTHNPKNQRVGICWSGGKRAYNSGATETDKRRSVPFEIIKPLLSIPGINWVSLQAENDSGLPNPGIKSFSDTAAIIDLLDAVVSVDTSVINLAGAMGKKTWLLNRYDHCWRWGAAETPWYPSIRDVRQTRYGVWDDVVARIKDDLEKECDKMAA